MKKHNLFFTGLLVLTILTACSTSVDEKEGPQNYETTDTNKTEHLNNPVLDNDRDSLMINSQNEQSK